MRRGGIPYDQLQKTNMYADGAGVGDSLNAAAGEANLANAGKKKKKKKVSTAGKNKRFNIEVDKPSAR